MLSRPSSAVSWTGIAVALPNTITYEASERLRLSSMLHIGAVSRKLVQANFSGLFTVQPIADGYQTSRRIIVSCAQSKSRVNFPVRATMTAHWLRAIVESLSHFP